MAPRWERAAPAPRAGEGGEPPALDRRGQAAGRGGVGQRGERGGWKGAKESKRKTQSNHSPPPFTQQWGAVAPVKVGVARGTAPTACGVPSPPTGNDNVRHARQGQRQRLAGRQAIRRGQSGEGGGSNTKKIDRERQAPAARPPPPAPHHAARRAPPRGGSGPLPPRRAGTTTVPAGRHACAHARLMSGSMSVTTGGPGGGGGSGRGTRAAAAGRWNFPSALNAPDLRQPSHPRPTTA